MSVNDITTLVVAVLALLISLLTFAYTVFIGPHLNMLIGGDIGLFYTSDMELYVVSDFTFFNGGAKPGVIVEILGTISTADGSEKPGFLRWRAFAESKNKNSVEPEKGTELWTSATSGPQTIVVPGRASGTGGAETKSIFLVTSEPFELHSGNYILELKGLVGPRLTRWCKARANLTIVEDDVNYLREYGIADASTGNSEAGLQLEMNPTRRSWISGLLRPASPPYASLLSNTTQNPKLPKTVTVASSNPGN